MVSYAVLIFSWQYLNLIFKLFWADVYCQVVQKEAHKPMARQAGVNTSADFWNFNCEEAGERSRDAQYW